MTTRFHHPMRFAQMKHAELSQVDQLLAVLAAHPLDRTFEAYGNFIIADPTSCQTGTPLLPAGWVMFWGNFATVSNCFAIDCGDPEIIAILTSAIRANQLRPDYLRQPPPFDVEKLLIERIRFSTTQGEVLLTYDGKRIEQYGDDIRARGGQRWDGHPDAYWVNVARIEVAKRHVAAFEAASRLVIA